MSITVVIPSHKRAGYLGTALESVRQQTALQFIDQIIVSENSYDDASKYVCEQFRDLPIKYIQQAPEITALEHLFWIIQQSESTYTAMLHDDDWWYPTHLENALKALENTSYASYFSNFILTQNEIGKAAFFHHPSMISYLLGDRPASNLISLTFEEVATLCYLYTPFHMSSMVSVTFHLKEANIEGLRNAKPWYADRIIYPYLGVHGNVIFNPQVLCGARLHERNDGKKIDNLEKIKDHIEGSEKIRQLAFSKGIDVIKKWESVKLRIPAAEWDDVRSSYRGYFGETGNSIFSFDVNPTPVPTSNRSTLRKIIKNILPHGIVLRSHKLFR